MTDIEKLKELEAKATKGPWETDDTESDGEYGIGDDTHSGFRASTIEAPDGHGGYVVLFDSLNSTASLIEEDHDEDGHIAWDEVARKNAAFIVAARNALPALLASLASKDAEIERLKAERENARSEASHIAKMFLRHRDLLLEIRDKITDEGDRCYFGSTNHADYLRDVAAEMNDYAWDRYMRATKWPDYIEKSRKANTRADSAESRLTTALAALGEARTWHQSEDKALSKSGRGDNDYYWRRAQHQEQIAELNATIAKLNALEGNEDE